MGDTGFRAWVTNGMLRKSLAVTRSLGYRGIDVFVSDTHTITPAAWSKYCRGHGRYPNPRTQTGHFYEWLEQQGNLRGPAVLFPMDDDVMDALIAEPHHLPNCVRVLLPPADVYWKMRNKASAVQAAGAFGFLCPDTYFGTDEGEFRMWLETRQFPIVLKANAQSGSRGFRVWHDSENLIRDWRMTVQSGNVSLAQQFVTPGERLDVCLLLDGNSQAVAGFVQRELRHFPVPYGPSSAQESIVDHELLAKCERFAVELGWTGIIEFEFLRDADSHQLYFMEANTRFWNSLACSMLAGVDFPYLYYQLCIGERVDPVLHYREGVRCRSLLPADMLHFFMHPKRDKPDMPFFAGPTTGGTDDILSLDDPCAAVGQILALLLSAGRRETWKDLLNRWV